MPYIHYRVPLVICMLACFLCCPLAGSDSWAKEYKEVTSAEPPAKNLRSRSKNASVKSGQSSPEFPQRTLVVREWFEKYDQIRRDAEMTKADKWQSLLLQAKKPEKKNADLAIRMSQKYTCALSEMKKLGSTSETQELQEGYIEYFKTARQLFEDYLVAQKAVPFTNQSLVPTKKKLEVLDKKNKKIDAALRKQYVIKKHRHS